MYGVRTRFDQYASGPPQMRWLIPVSAALLLLGCAHRPARPAFEARHCDRGSYPVRARYRGEVQTVCAIVAPECVNNAKSGQMCPIVGFIGMGEVNTLLDPDGDDAAKEKRADKHHGWQIWKRSGKDRD